MSIRILKWAVAGAGVVGLAGCATVPREAGFGDVQQAIAARTGTQVQWRGNTTADAAADAAVKSMLQNELTADEAVQVALLNNLTLQATYQDLGVAQADVVQAGLLPNPVLTAERRFAPGWGGQAAEIDVTFDFLQVFFIPLRKRVAAAAFETAKARVGQAVLETAADVREAYYTYQADLQMLEMRRTVLAAADAQAEAARRLRAAGNTNRLDLDTQLALAERARLDVAGAEADAVLARERLTALMGLWGPQTDWKIPPHLPELPAGAPTAAGLESQAVANRLDLAAARSEIVAAAQSLGLARAQRFIPALTVGGHYEHEIEGGVKSIGPSADLTLPLFDQGQAVTARGRALLQQSRLRYAALAVQIRSEVRAAYARTVAARDRASFYRRSVLPLQARILDQTQLQYNGMFVGVFQLLQARRDQIDAGRDYIEALRDYWIARGELEKALGSRVPGAPAAATQPAARPELPAPQMGPMKDTGDMKGMPGM
jgi:cobalt-zinc-cadmium efflux system outer membrane protein